MPSNDIEQKVIIKSDTITLCDNFNASMCLEIVRNKTWGLDFKVITWDDLIINVGPRIDCDIKTVIKLFAVKAKDLRDISKLFSNLADNLEDKNNEVAKSNH